MQFFIPIFSFFFTAYEVLSDENKRRQYDQFGEEGLNQNGFNNGGGFQGFDFGDIFGGFGGGEQRSGGGGFKFSFGGFDDFFNDEDEDQEDDFGGMHFGDSFFGGGEHFRQNRFGSGFGEDFPRAARHAEFHQHSSSSGGRWNKI